MYTVEIYSECKLKEDVLFTSTKCADKNTLLEVLNSLPLNIHRISKIVIKPDTNDVNMEDEIKEFTHHATAACDVLSHAKFVKSILDILKDYPEISKVVFDGHDWSENSRRCLITLYYDDVHMGECVKGILRLCNAAKAVDNLYNTGHAGHHVITVPIIDYQKDDCTFVYDRGVDF